MAKTKTIVDKDEVNEIINLFIKEQGGIVPELKFKAISDFNNKIANNEKYKRSNGTLYTLYKYNFWGGSYKGEFNYGKLRIIELNEKNKVQVVGKEFDSDMADIVTLVNDLYKKPQELTKYLISIFEKERKKAKNTETELKDAKDKIDILEDKIANLEEGIANLIYQSQSPNNSLNNMMNLSTSTDSICYDELKHMFDNTNRFERLKNNSEQQVEGVISIDEINRQKRLKELEEDGF
ncbi:hypothetical protein [Clostridium sp. C2-6-12]|uniref:hypothetical protein n=1 Tax=Clostridium sp. C2-6-12 TaxID=2698832 RepID=UPI00136FF790|nr:hypothetical protein [Clostridium sp. C2-6-12]